MSTYRSLFLQLLFLTLLARQAVAAPTCGTPISGGEIREILTRTETSYRGVITLCAKFKQTDRFSTLDASDTSSGGVCYKRPGRMDWDYQSPAVQRFVSDGKTIYFYNPELNTLRLLDLKDSFETGTPVSFLLGVGRLTESFKADSGCRVDGGYQLRLVPVERSAALTAFNLTVDDKEYLPRDVIVSDEAGNEHQITLTEIKINSELSNARFQFAVPKGVDIIDERKPKTGGGMVQELPLDSPKPVVVREDGKPNNHLDKKKK